MFLRCFRSLAFLAPAVLIFCVAAYGQIADSPDDSVANIPVNYTEAKVGTYALFDPLVLANGQPVRDAKTWFEKRRPEILRLVEENWFGRAPEAPADMSFDIFLAGQERPEDGAADLSARQRPEARAAAAQLELLRQ